MKIKLHFGMIINIDSPEGVDDLGKELAIFLHESFFNGEDVVEVTYDGHDC